jgi:single-strand DNA-binding protein
MLPNISGEFRVVTDPVLRFTPAGKAVASCRIVADKKKKTDGGEWVDDKVCWLNLSIWEQQAENFAESIEKGMLIFVTGRLETREYEKDGEKRMSLDVTADNVAPSIRWATAKVTKAQRSGGQSTQPAAAEGAPAAAPADPWQTPPSQGDEPPF